MMNTCVACGKYAPEGKQICWICEQDSGASVAAKYDQDKPRLDLVPPGIIEAVGQIRTYGVDKYKTVDGWRKVEPERYRAALVRHLCEYLREPQSIDSESGYPHLWHMACNIAFLIEMYDEVR